MIERVIINVTGRVQGVFFRAGIKEIADVLGITGWAKNESDGSVTIVAEGKKEDLQKLIEWCKKGTEWAIVDDVRVEWKEATKEFSAFSIFP